MKLLISKNRIVLSILIAVLTINTISCNQSKPTSQNTNDTLEQEIDIVEQPSNQGSVSNTPTPEPEPVILTAFQKDAVYLTDKGIRLPDIPPDGNITKEIILTLLTDVYEILGGEIDTTKINPRYEASDDIKKLTLLGIYDSNFFFDNTLNSELEYGSVAYYLMKLQDTIQKRLYWRDDTVATAKDLLRRINLSTILHTWKQDSIETKVYTMPDLLEEAAVPSDQPLSRLMIAEMMVSAFEDICGEIQYYPSNKPVDSDNMYAWKSNQFFIWPDSEYFESDKTGSWDDGYFMSTSVFDSQLRFHMNLDEAKCPYGAVLSALAYLMSSYEGIEQNPIEENIVLNERPYDWHVNQMESGDYGAVNCMPACVEMAMWYQGLTDVPSTESLRNDYPLDGTGWNDILAENVMLRYGLQFTDSFDIQLDAMIKELDKGNVLYVMYREETNQEGHSVIIKGYRKLGDNTHFIISDPAYNLVGPYGYLEYIKEAETMLIDMIRHVPRYFIIPSGK